MGNFLLDTKVRVQITRSFIFKRADRYLLFTDVRVGLLSYGRRYGLFLCYEAAASRALIL